MIIRLLYKLIISNMKQNNQISTTNHSKMLKITLNVTQESMNLRLMVSVTIAQFYCCSLKAAKNDM